MPPKTDPEVFSFEPPEYEHKKDVIRLADTDSFKADMQIVREGGANNLHSHTGNDGFWFVLDGEARFYTEEDEVVAELGEREGILIPHDYPYWVESAGETPLTILHVASYVEGVEDQRVNHQPDWRKQSAE